MIEQESMDKLKEALIALGGVIVTIGATLLISYLNRKTKT